MTSYHSRTGIMIHGFGQIGQSLVRQILKQEEGTDPSRHFEFVSLADRSGTIYAERGFDSHELNQYFSLKEKGLKLKLSQRDERSHLSQLKGRIFADLTDADTYSLIKEAVEEGLDVVMANKKPLAVRYDEYAELFALAKSRGRRIRYEATVGAGLPVLDTIHKLESSGDEIEEIVGSLSGTIGFLISRIEEGTDFSAAILEASALGYTEPDPREDLSGKDVARKALILARRIGLKIDFDAIQLEGLDGSDDFYRESVARAQSENRVLRFVARIRHDGVRVGLESLPKTHVLARLRGTENLISIKTRRYADLPLCISGPGAGAEVTAAGVLNDIHFLRGR